MQASKPFVVVSRRGAALGLALFAALLQICSAVAASAEPSFPSPDGYDSSLARSIRHATARYRLAVWARLDGYVQSTDYIPSFGTMYVNHERFDPASLEQPTLLIYDAAGRLAGCGYQFRTGDPVLPQLSSAAGGGWYDIPSHVHYNIAVDGKLYYAQQPWNAADAPTRAALVERKLMPANATLRYAFFHPPTHAIVIWAWLPNPNGLSGAENPSVP